MSEKRKIALCQRLRNEPRGMNRVLSLLCAVVFLISQIVPAAAANSATWVEVCGGAGTYLTLVDQGSENPDQQCKRCPLCLVRNDKAAAVSAGGQVTFRSIHFIWASYPHVAAAPPLGRQWYWHYSRGPPPVSFDISMISTAYLVDQNLVGPQSENPWRASWV